MKHNYNRYYISTGKLKVIMISLMDKIIFDQPARNDLITYDSIMKIVTGKEIQLAVSWRITISKAIIRP